jgi:hypothetical protein
MTLGAAAAKLRLMVWCKARDHRSEPDPANQAPGMVRRRLSSNGAHDWFARGVGAGTVDMVVSGAKRR